MSNSKTQLDQIQNFRNLVNRENKNGFIKMVYRGDKVVNLFNRMNIFYDASVPDWSPVLERLFMLGEKSKHFFSDDFKGFHSKNFEIEDISDLIFKEIFLYMNTATKNKNLHPAAFFRKNPGFANFFKDKTNIPKFIEMIRKHNEKEIFGIKNYYLTILHQLGVIRYKANSIMLSTSESKQAAIQFARHTKSNPGYLVHAWSPLGPSFEKVIRKTALPKYDKQPFKKQKEISFFAGILPHYIIGLQVLGNGLFFHNPAILNQENSLLTLFTGLDVDQTNLDIIKKLTALTGTYTTYGEIVIQESIH